MVWLPSPAIRRCAASERLPLHNDHLLMLLAPHAQNPGCVCTDHYNKGYPSQTVAAVRALWRERSAAEALDAGCCNLSVSKLVPVLLCALVTKAGLELDLRCRLWREAAALAARCCDEELEPDSEVQLSSSLLRELCSGSTRLSIRPSHYVPISQLHTLKTFLQATQPTHVTIRSDSRLQSAMVDSLLPSCPWILELTCTEKFLPHQLPPGLTGLVWWGGSPHDPPSEQAMAAEDAQMLLTRTQQLCHLQSLALGWLQQDVLPASLAPFLPASLQSISVSLCLDGKRDDAALPPGSPSGLELGAFSRAEGCTAQVSLRVQAPCLRFNSVPTAAHQVFQAGLLPCLRAIGPVHSLWIEVSMSCVLALLPELAPLVSDVFNGKAQPCH